jgi:hypothetical protein
MHVFPFRWLGTLSTIGSVLTLLVILVGLALSIVAYLQRDRSRAALLGAIGFGLMLLLSCCSTGWALADRPLLRRIPSRSTRDYQAAKVVVLFLLGLVNLGGLALIVSAIWTGGRKG